MSGVAGSSFRGGVQSVPRRSIVEPREVPDFYGYGSDITVNLDTGERLERRPMRLRWQAIPETAWALFLVVTVGLPLLFFLFLRGDFNWRRGPDEWTIREQERKGPHAPGCDCSKCSKRRR